MTGLLFGTLLSTWLGCFRFLSFQSFHPLCQVHHVGGVDAEEDVQDLRLPLPCLDPPHRVMLLLGPERAFHCSGPNPRKFLAHIILLLLPLGRTAKLDKRGLDAVLLAEVAAVRAGIARVAAYPLHVHPEQAPVHLDAVTEPRPLVEGVERQLLDERDPVHHDVVALRTELDIFHLLAPDNGPHVRLRHAHYPVGDALPAVAAVEVVALLAVHLGDDVDGLPLPDGQQLTAVMLALHPADLLQHLPEQVQQAARHLFGLGVAVLALLAVRQVGLLHVEEFRPRATDTHASACLAHDPV